MKKLFVILSLVFCVSGWANTEQQFLTLDTGTDEYKSYKLATAKAQLYMQEGMSGLNETGKTLATRVMNALSRASFRVSINSITEQLCTNLGAGAFVNSRIFDVIFVCGGVRERIQGDHSVKDLKLLAQLFIHEGVHLTGNRNECDTTYFEVTIMNNTSDGLLSRGSIDKYQSLCKFQF